MTATLRGMPATLIASAAAPNSSSDQTGIRLARPRVVARTAPGQRERHQERHRHRQHRKRAECPTPGTELGEQPTRGGTEQGADAPHRRDEGRRLRPQRRRQSRIDHGVAQPGEQTARGALHGATDQQQLHGRSDRGTSCCPPRTRRERPGRTTAARAGRQRGADGRRRDHRCDQIHRRHPGVEPLTADLGDRARQQADGEELVGGVQRHAAGQHRGRAEVLRTQQVPPAGARHRISLSHADYRKSSTAVEIKRTTSSRRHPCRAVPSSGRRSRRGFGPPARTAGRGRRPSSAPSDP